MAALRGPGDQKARIQAVDPAAEYAGLKPEIDAAVTRVLASGRYIGGPEVEGLEREFAEFCGVAHAVAVSSGTDALRFALMAAGLGHGGTPGGASVGGAPGDLPEVITTPLTFIGTTEAISQAGGRPVFVDVDPVSLTLDPARLEGALTRRTRAIVPIHLFGQTADMDPILDCARRQGIAVIEDACQAHGALYAGRAGGAGGAGRAAGALGGAARAAGSLGDAGCFSFYPSKNLGACGEGGLVTTARADVADRVRRLRDHGQSEKYVHAEEGYNGRLDAVQAAILRVKLKRLAARNERRRALAARYGARLTELGLAAPPGRGDLAAPPGGGGDRRAGAPLRLPVEKPWGTHAYHLYTVRLSPDEARPGAASLRDRVRAALLEQGIETGIHYPIPLHLQPAYAWMDLREGAFPEAELAAREVLSLPIHPEMTDDQVDRVCAALATALVRR